MVESNPVKVFQSITGLDTYCSLALLQMFEFDVNSSIDYYFLNSSDTSFINNIKEAGGKLQKASGPLSSTPAPSPKVIIETILTEIPEPEDLNSQQENIVPNTEAWFKRQAMKKEEEEKKLEPIITPTTEYAKLMEPLKVQNIDMEASGNIYLQTARAGVLNPLGAVRLIREISSLSKDLPCYPSNAAFIRVDKQRTDLMKIMIMGSEDTPYAHGAFEFDFFAGHSYPNQPPKMTLLTTGNGQVRFNPNLYNNGYVCLSLLGTWSGHGSENWLPTSTILQLIISLQSLVMNEDIYYNEPSFAQSKGSPSAKYLNTAYSNIVKYCNVRFAMIEQIKKPPKGFEDVVKIHFKQKKAIILSTVNKWIENAEKEPAEYTGLIASHNSAWCTFFDNNNAVFKERLKQAYNDLEKTLNSL